MAAKINYDKRLVFVGQEQGCYNLEGGCIEDQQATVPLYQRQYNKCEM